MDDKGCMDFGAKAMPLLAMGAFIDRWTDGWMDGWMCRRVDCRPNTTRRRVLKKAPLNNCMEWMDQWMEG